MKRRIIGIAAAFCLASVGTVVLVAYVRSAHDEALAAEALVSVYVVQSAVPEGTRGEDIRESITQSELPAKLVADGAVRDLSSLEGLVTNTELLAGEQLVAGRFVTPTVARQGDVPPGLLQVTVELDPQRALGGRIRAGDTVAVLLSFSPFDLQGAVLDSKGGVTTIDGKTSNTTHLELHKVLVTSVQIAEQATGVPDVAGDGEEPTDPSGVESAPSDVLLVTLALDAPSIEQLVFAAEFGTVWLASEPGDAPEAGTRIVDRGNAYDPIVVP
jgi:pilus assembly protein CpaB